MFGTYVWNTIDANKIFTKLVIKSKLNKIYFEFFYLKTIMDSHEGIRKLKNFRQNTINFLIYFPIMESSFSNRPLSAPFKTTLKTTLFYQSGWIYCSIFSYVPFHTLHMIHQPYQLNKITGKRNHIPNYKKKEKIFCNSCIFTWGYFTKI